MSTLGSHYRRYLPSQRSVLEYVTQDDADYAVKKLDGRELRGITVRVEPDVSVILSRLSSNVAYTFFHSVEAAGATLVVSVIVPRAGLVLPNGKSADLLKAKLLTRECQG